ncbi:hypothetical protein [Acinetobacter venetianus]|uniref:hypothetical protein n=1 Tax=Acinetobacter venetianus TaxID=52133 RepID=UPI003F8F387C
METDDFVTFRISLNDDSIVDVQVAINYEPPLNGSSQHFLVNGTARNLGEFPEPRYIVIKDKEVFVPNSNGPILIGVLVR